MRQEDLNRLPREIKAGAKRKTIRGNPVSKCVRLLPAGCISAVSVPAASPALAVLGAGSEQTAANIRNPVYLLGDGYFQFHRRSSLSSHH